MKLKEHKKVFPIGEKIYSFKQQQGIGCYPGFKSQWQSFFECVEEGIGAPFGLSTEDFQGQVIRGMYPCFTSPWKFSISFERPCSVSGFTTQNGSPIPSKQTYTQVLLFDPRNKTLTGNSEAHPARYDDMLLMAKDMMKGWDPIVLKHTRWTYKRIVVFHPKMSMESTSLGKVAIALEDELCRYDFRGYLRKLKMPREVLKWHVGELKIICMKVLSDKLYEAWKNPIVI